MLSIITPFDFDAWINSRPLIIIPTWCSPFILKIARSPLLTSSLDTSRPTLLRPSVDTGTATPKRPYT